MRTTTEQRARVIELHKKHPDLSNRVIAERIGVSIPTVRNVIRVAKTAKAGDGYLTTKDRTELAKKAAAARWRKPATE